MGGTKAISWIRPEIGAALILVAAMLACLLLAAIATVAAFFRGRRFSKKRPAPPVAVAPGPLEFDLIVARTAARLREDHRRQMGQKPCGGGAGQLDVGRVRHVSQSFGLWSDDAREERTAGNESPALLHAALLREFDGAIASGQLWNAYRPLLDLATRRIIGAHALPRWIHPRRGPIAPADFIAALDGAGKVHDLARQVAGQAIEDAACWHGAGQALAIGFDLGASLLGDHALAEIIAQHALAAGLSGERILLSIDAASALASPARHGLAGWRSLGVDIVADRFCGEGDAEALRLIGVSVVRLDERLVAGVRAGPAARARLGEAIDRARSAGMLVVAGGVAWPDYLARLADLGCAAADGPAVGVPGPADTIVDLIDEPRVRAA